MSESESGSGWGVTASDAGSGWQDQGGGGGVTGGVAAACANANRLIDGGE